MFLLLTNKVQWKTNMLSYLNVISQDVWFRRHSYDFFTGNFKVANKNRVSKCSGFKWLRLGAQTICKKE